MLLICLIVAFLINLGIGASWPFVLMLAIFLYAGFCWRLHVTTYMIIRDVALTLSSAILAFLIAGLLGLWAFFVGLPIAWFIIAQLYPTKARYPIRPI